MQQKNHKIELTVVDKIVKAITKSFDLDIVGQSIVDTMVYHLNSLGGTLLLVDQEKQLAFAHSTSSTLVINQIVRMLKKTFREHKYHFSEPSDNLIVKTIREKKVFKNSDFSKFISPEVPHGLAKVIEKIARVKSSVTLPVIMDEKVIGVLFISFNRVHLTSKEIATLSVFADFAAIAINNALKYEQLTHRYKELNDRFELEKEITSTLSHELRTPITIAYNNVQFFKSILDKYHLQLGEKFKPLHGTYEDLEISIKRMDEICKSIFGLMDVENNAGVSLHKLNLKKQLAQILDIYKKKFQEKNLDLKVEFDFNGGIYYGGGIQLEQVLVILLDNALKYTRKGAVEVSMFMNNEKICCSVSDTGPGIPKNKREKVFERFYRHRSLANRNLFRIEGLGLGLFIAKKIINKLKGKIFIEDNENKKGVKFVFEIPTYSSIEAI